jgi:hypothetical protein
MDRYDKTSLWCHSESMLIVPVHKDGWLRWRTLYLVTDGEIAVKVNRSQ